jgi:hypothetical protein
MAKYTFKRCRSSRNGEEFFEKWLQSAKALAFYIFPFAYTACDNSIQVVVDEGTERHR